MAKPGCGPLAAIILVFLFLFVFSANQSVEYYFVNCPDEEIIDCFLAALDSEPEPESEGAVTATGVYELKGNTVNVSANIPLEGGAVTGTVSGTCDGKITGTFDGRNNGVFSGKMTGVCAPFFVNIPASAEFSGTVNKTGKTVPFSFTGRGGGFTHEGSMTLTYQ